MVENWTNYFARNNSHFLNSILNLLLLIECSGSHTQRAKTFIKCGEIKLQISSIEYFVAFYINGSFLMNKTFYWTTLERSWEETMGSYESLFSNFGGFYYCCSLVLLVFLSVFYFVVGGVTSGGAQTY